MSEPYMGESPMNMTMRTRVAIESARRLVANKASTSNSQNFPIPAVDVAEALIELHDILHDLAGERAGYRVKAERYEAAFTALQKEILDGVGKVVDGVDVALSTAEKTISGTEGSHGEVAS